MSDLCKNCGLCIKECECVIETRACKKCNHGAVCVTRKEWWCDICHDCGKN